MQSSNVPALGEAAPSRVIQVAASTSSTQLAGSIAEEVRQNASLSGPFNVSLHAIGPAAVNQAVKAVPIANGMIASAGKVITILPSFADAQVDDKHGGHTTKTVMQMRLVIWRIGG